MIAGQVSSRCSRPSALVLAAHGCGDASDANARVRLLARLLASQEPGRQVVVAFELGSPTFRDALGELDLERAGHRVQVVPIMAAAGFFTRQRLPEAFAARAQALHVEVRITTPLGSHAAVILGAVARTAARLRSLGPDVAAGHTAVLVAGHGTVRDSRSGASTMSLVGELRRSQPGLRVVGAFLDQEPRLETVAAELSARRLIVVPYLFGGGAHLQRDLGARLDGSGPEVLIEPALSDAPALPAALAAVTDLAVWREPRTVVAPMARWLRRVS
ncbi:MAG: CbiX/SirB N-terminal domain-containing protein [Acidobacteriota bacterium]